MGTKSRAQSYRKMEIAKISTLIHTIRGQRVMLDRDLAKLYGVMTGELNQAVKRQANRFPNDFMFRLTPEEEFRLISQSVISKKGRGGQRFCRMSSPSKAWLCCPAS